MRKFATALTALLCLASISHAQDQTQVLTPPGAAAGAAAEGNPAAASYGIGYDIGMRIAGGGVTAEDIKQAELVRGIMDALAGKEPNIKEDVVRAAMEALGKSIMMRKQAAMTAFLAENAKKDGVQKTDSGLQFRVLKQGSGAAPKEDSKVTVHYEGRLVNGQVFDSSIQRGEPATFGVGQVIAGWTEALLRMKVGDKLELVIPPNLAYGQQGSPPVIGPNEVLIFQVELLEVE